LPEQYDQSPLPTSGLTDYHVHPDFSVDAEGTVRDFCERALVRGLAGLCFTTHFDANPDSDGLVNFIRVGGVDRPATVENLRPYVEAVSEARAVFGTRGLRVLPGVEFGWYPGCEGQVEELRRVWNFDYVLCGIHELENICLCSQHNVRACFSRYDASAFTAKYFEQACAAAGSGLFDAMAHVPYYLRYGPGFYGADMLTLHERHAERFFSACVKTHTALEINTSGIRHGRGHYYPPDAVIMAAREAGVVVDRLGSDAHHPEQLALDFDRAAAWLQTAPPAVPS
jgi:histidinol-phosphatase (PHP family)